MKYIILFLFPLASYGQVQQQDTAHISMTQLHQFKKDRTIGKTVQLFGSVALGAYFLMEKSYDNKIENGDTDAKRAPKALPVIGCAFLMVGITIDMGAVDHLFKKRRRSKQP